MSLTLDELIIRVIQQYDPDDIIEALEITSEELLDVPLFIDKLNDNRYKFSDIDGEQE